VPAIEVRGLEKHYGSVAAVVGVDLEVRAGEVFALLGPNGAGKSTTVEILEGHRHRSAGSVSVLGFDPEVGGRPFRERIGIVLQNSAIEKELTVRESLDLYGSMYPRRRRPEELIALVGLDAKADARIKTLSGGQRRRLELALGIVGDPDLIFLDEPTTGFDPSARRQAWGIVDNLRSLGKTILLTTHYMDEAQHLADRIAVIASGVIVAAGTPGTLGDRHQAASVIRFNPHAHLDPAELPADVRDRITGLGDEMVTIRTEEPTRTLHAITGWALAAGIELDSLAVERPSLEDVYLELTGEERADG
jgi:ABC-2 type transport system ATP-binding protein